MAASAIQEVADHLAVACQTSSPKSNQVATDFMAIALGSVQGAAATRALDAMVKCDETLSGWGDVNYRGCQTKTRGGYTCAKWATEPEYSKRRPYYDKVFGWPQWVMKYKVGDGSGRAAAKLQTSWIGHHNY